MAMLGAAVGRKVWFDQDAHTLYPMLNLLLIGPSGIGKSTSILKYGWPLIANLPPDLRPQLIQGKATPEALHEELVAEPHALVFASELANFFSRSKYMEDMIPYVTQLLDYEPIVERRTRSSGLLTVKAPSVSIVGGSTVEWLQGQLPDSAASGGFLARFLILKEDHKGQRVPDAKAMFSKAKWIEIERLREQVYRDFERIVGQYAGEIRWRDFSASDAYATWYQTQVPDTGHLSPFSARAGEFVLRIAMLLALSCERDYLLDTDIHSAISLYNYATKKLQEVVVPYSPAGKLIAAVLKCIAERPMYLHEIARAMRNTATYQDVERIVTSLLHTKDIKQLPDNRFTRA